MNFRFHPKVCDGCCNEIHNYYYYKVFLKNVHINNTKMQYYYKIDISEDIYVNKTGASAECIICYWVFFFKKDLRFNRLSAMGVMMSMNLDNITILNIHGVDYHCIISGISKIETVNLLQNADKSVIVLKNNLIANPSTMKFF